MTGRARAAVALGAALAMACGSRAGGLHYSGVEGQATPTLVWQNLMLADVVVDASQQGRVVVDTGSPYVVLSPSTFPAVRSSASETVDSLSFGQLAFQNLTIVGATAFDSPDRTVPIAGVVGCTILCNFQVSLNYRDAWLILGTAPLPAGVELSGGSVPFMLMGGTAGFPASRIIVDAVIEGTNYGLLLDSGATYVNLRTSLFDAIASDGRSQFALQAVTVQGTLPAAALRLKALGVAGELADRVVVTSNSGVDGILKGISDETGHPVDGVLGGSFLRDFFVTIDYPNHTLHLARFLTGSPTFDEFDRVGITVSSSTQCTYVVNVVVPGTDAAQRGLAAGDAILAVDGHQLAPLGLVEASQLLCGPVGTQKSVTFGATQSATLDNQTVSLRVDDLLP